jgi:pyruvate/2-oxoglutarate dehydrogenase complex dihydrolipoamide dehydrogenase (E3) component
MCVSNRSLKLIEGWPSLRRPSISISVGYGEFVSSPEITVDDRLLTAETIAVNTDARPLVLPIDGIDEVETLDSTSMLELDEVPNHLLVIGGGYVGSEYAQMFARFGADVTLTQRDERLIPREEPDVEYLRIYNYIYGILIRKVTETGLLIHGPALRFFERDAKIWFSLY